MKILIVGCFDLLMHPYSEKYIEIFNANDIDFDMIYWNRSGDRKPGNHYIPFQFPLNTYSSRISKLKGYVKYRNFVLSYLRSKRYDRVVFLTTQTMVFFFPIAFKKFKHKYIFDYRDETYESNIVYRMIVQMCIHNSFKVAISSPGFIKLFNTSCKDKFVLCHNAKKTFNSIPITKLPYTKTRIVYWGQIRLPEYFIKIIRIFENDPHFELHFHGEGNSEALIKYVKENNINNVFFSGRFNQDEIEEFAINTDILMNCYPNDSYQKLALTVKMYEGIGFGIPMLLQKGSFMSEYLKNNEYPFIEVDFDNVVNPDSIKSTIQSFNKGRMDKNRIVDVIHEDQVKFNHEIEKFIQGESK